MTDFHLLVGRSDSVTSKPHYIRIRGGGGSRAERDARIAEIERDIAASSDSAQHGVLESGRIEMLKRRAGMLQGEMHIIRVGGDSYKEKKNRALIYEDAILAVKSSIKHGVTLGGNVSIHHAIRSNKKELSSVMMSNIYNEAPNIMINMTYPKMLKIVNDILDIIANESLSAFRAVCDNASRNKRFKKSIFKYIKSAETCVNFNLLKNRFECFGHCDTTIGPHIKLVNGDTPIWQEDFPDLMAPGNMDKETLRAIFSILGLFLTSNQLITVLTKRDNKV
jgi:hypothetical protein